MTPDRRGVIADNTLILLTSSQAQEVQLSADRGSNTDAEAHPLLARLVSRAQYASAMGNKSALKQDGKTEELLTESAARSE